jgi:hypothetical protein
VRSEEPVAREGVGDVSVWVDGVATVADLQH